MPIIYNMHRKTTNITNLREVQHQIGVDKSDGLGTFSR